MARIPISYHPVHGWSHVRSLTRRVLPMLCVAAVLRVMLTQMWGRSPGLMLTERWSMRWRMAGRAEMLLCMATAVCRVLGLPCSMRVPAHRCPGMMPYMTGSMCWRQVVMMLTRRMRWRAGSAVLWMPSMGRSWRQSWRGMRLMVWWLPGGCQMW